MLVVDNENMLPKISIIEMSLIDSFHIRSLVVTVTGNKWNLSEHTFSIISRQSGKKKKKADIPWHIDLFE